MFVSGAVDLEVRDNRSERTEITRRRSETDSDPKRSAREPTPDGLKNK